MTSPAKILIVEDDGLVFNITRYILEKEGYKVVWAKDGNEGVAALGTQDLDLILMDIALPYRSGLEVISLAKRSIPDVPIIVVSALGLVDETVQEAMGLGVSEIISKPFSPMALLKKVDGLLKPKGDQ